LANIITISRFPLLFIFIFMLYFGNPMVRLISFPLLFIALIFDSIDGIIARKTGKVSLSGSVLDIAADRAYELVLWVSFSDLGLIPVVIPIIVITRTVLTDAIRSLGIRDGTAPFDQHETKLGKLIVRSRGMRLGYGGAKLISFCGLTLGLALSGFPEGTANYDASSMILTIFTVTSWIALVLCVVRGLPVILGAIKRSLRNAEKV
jgi:CDP-diacylglycerol--glycerol-3-phosphate 3-phosphatidyltransferase